MVATLAQVVQLLSFYIENGSLVVRVRGWEIQGPAHAAIDGKTRGHFPVVLNKVLLTVGAGTNDLLLPVDGKLLNLTEKETGQRVARGRSIRARLVRKQLCELEDARGVGGLDHIEPLPTEVDAEFH